MGHAEAVAAIHAPVETVWNCLNDIDHTPEWVVGLDSAEIKTSGPYGVGTIYHDYNHLGPIRQSTPWHITAFEPMTRQVHESDSKTLPSTMILNLFAIPEGTRLHLIVDYRFLPRLGPVSRLWETLVMNRLLGGVLKRNLSNLDQYLRRQGS